VSAGSAAVWSEPLEREGASARLLAATLTLSSFAGWALPGNRLGLGAVLVACGIAAVVLWARAAPLRPDNAAYAGLALALASMAAVRSAEWLLALDGLAAAALATLAVAGGRTWEEVRRAPAVLASRVAEAVPYLGRGARRLTGGRRFSPALRGIGLGAILLAVFGGLFVSADRAFAELTRDFLLPDINLALLPARVAVFIMVAVSATGLVIGGPRFAHLGPPRFLEALHAAIFEREEEGERPRWQGLAPMEWMLSLGLLDLLFVAFVTVQIAILFAGHDYVLRTAGLTYAEYARQGFFQLLAAAALTLGVVAGASRWARPRDVRDARVLDVLLGVLLLLTLVVLASALKRLLLYEQAFGFTRLRISVHAVILWLAGVLVLVMVAGALHRGRWLPRALVGFSAAAMLVFNVTNPDGVVASRNVARFAETGRVDLSYLAELSPDAVPSLSALPPTLRACVLEEHTELLADPDYWPAWNLGRARARTVLEHPTEVPCST
jgi:hypothetical protein